MESANLKVTEHKLSAEPSNCFGYGIISNNNNHHAWSNISSSTTTSSSSTTPPFSDYTNYDSGVISNSSSTSNSRHKSCDHQANNNNDNNKNLVSSYNHHHHDLTNSNIMVNGLGLIPTWNSTSTSNQASYDMQIERIKEEISESYPKFTELLNSPSSSNIEDYDPFLLPSDIKNINHHCDDQSIPGAEFHGQTCNNNHCRGQFSHIYPSVNVTSNNYQYYNSLKPTFDHLASARFMSQQLSLNDNISLAVFGSNNFGDLADDHLHQPHNKLSRAATNQMISSLNSEASEELETRSMEITSDKFSAPNKKSRMESRAPSCPPFKVRKEKLGDRIAALQQLVSPFGKTDTASVLMEAIGYIKFLQNQVETLSVPYMKSLRNKSTKTIMQGVEEAKRDLRSKGLCLVPLSCMSYVTGDHGGGTSIWPPPNFGDT